jgi:2-iminobutanoate/2-iminopropanoate deaminase
MNRAASKYAGLALVIVAAAALTVAGSSHNSARRAINPPGSKPDAPFSNGLLVGNTLYVAGQQGLVEGKLQPGGIVPETQAALDNIKKILELGGMQMSDVVTATVYLADMNDFAAMSNTYKTYFPEPRPARATVQVAGLVGNARVEISVIAVKQH